MGSITYDGRSFMIDGRRIWIISASLSMFRIPRAQWKDRIHAARLAGFNTIEVPIPWCRIEPRPGQFDFTDNNDIRHFVELVAEAGMWCILRPGPYIGDGWDLGGIPSWILAKDGVKLRAPNQPFHESCSRYISALSGQLRTLQVTSSGSGGPILLIQVETQWTCSHKDMGTTYLGELNRYLRESGFTVPMINANNLWQGVESEIDCWVGERDMLSIMRQLGTVLPDQPRMVIDFGPKTPARLGLPEPEPMDPQVIQRSLAEILAGGGQYNFIPFAAGQTPGFWGGQMLHAESPFLGPVNELQAPIDVLGRPTARFHHVRTISTFASTFGKVFAHLDPQNHSVVLDPIRPGESKAGRADFGPTVVHRTGSQGSVAFIFSTNAHSNAKTRGSVNLMLADGSYLPVDLGGKLVHWCLFDAHISGRSTLTYSSLCVLGVCGQTIVVFGGPGTVGRIAINGSPLEVDVPSAKTPTILVHEGITVVVCSDQQIEETFIGTEAVYVGVSGIDASGKPFGTGRCTRISSKGEVSTQTLTPRSKSKTTKITRGVWEAADTIEHAAGTNPRFATIPSPAPLSQLGSPQGYGWYRATEKVGAAKKCTIAAPTSGDRFQVFLDGVPVGVMGRGPGATEHLGVSFKKGEHTIVLLADNMGYVSEGSNCNEGKKGLCDQLWEVTQVKIGKPRIVEGTPLSPLTFKSPLFGVRDDDQTHPSRVSWTIAHRRKSPLFVSVAGSPTRGLLILNDQPVRYLEAGEHASIVLDGETLKRGNNAIEFAMVHEFGDEDVATAQVNAVAEKLGVVLTVWEGDAEITAKSTWAFAKWEKPMDSMFAPVGKSSANRAPIPTWWKTTFEAPSTGDAITLHLTGMTKGQVFLNGKHVCRYFVALANGTPVPPTDTVVLAASDLAEGENELVLFDEHGGNPEKCKFVIESAEDAIRATT